MNLVSTAVTWSLILVDSSPDNNISCTALAIISFFLLITFSELPERIGTKSKVFSIIGNCEGVLASSNKAKSSTSSNQTGIRNISPSVDLVLVV